MQSIIKATAYADLAVVERHGVFAFESFQAYFTTLRRVQHQLRNLERSNDTESLATHDIFAAVLVLDSYELLYIRRPTPLGIHTLAITRLVEMGSQSHRMQDQRTIALARAAAPRIQARQLLSTQPLLGTSIRAIAQLAESPVDARIARFVADACDDMHVLEAAQRRLTTIEEATAAQAVRHSANVLYELLRELEDWLEHCGTLVLPELTRVPLYIPGTVEWPLPRSATTTTILTCEHIWVARAWTLIHMCYVRISDALLGSGTHDTVVHGIDGACGTIAGEGDRVPQLHARLNTSSRLLLDLAPFLMGLTDEFGCARTTPVLQDTGLLIVQYPLWTIGQSKFGPSPATKREASELLGFIEEQLRVVDRVT